MKGFSNINEQDYAEVVGVSHRENSIKESVARGSIYMKKDTLNAIIEGKISKGDVLSVAQVGGIMGAKSTSDIIPMCHSISTYGADIEFKIHKDNCRIDIIASVRAAEASGADMQALTAVSIAALTIYDMCKAIDREMVITDIFLVKRQCEASCDIYDKVKRNAINTCCGDMKMEKAPGCRTI